MRALRCELAALRFRLALKRYIDRCAKANFNPSQPRVPAGHPDGGQWTDDPRRAGGGDGDLGESNDSGDELTDISAARRRTPPGIGHNEGPPLEDPPEIPTQRPSTRREINDFLKAAARWLAKAIRVGGPVAAFVAAYEAMSWLDTDRIFFEAYQDPPTALEELQRAVSTKRYGYDIHHIVEQTPAKKDGFPRSMIDAPENLVRIPTLKHWDINRWFETKSADYGGLTPREYLHGKDWDVRRRVGLRALIEAGVLKP